MKAKQQLFIDLDGVLVDFDRGVLAICGGLPDELAPNFMWRAVSRTAGFYEHLAWLPDGRELWAFAVRHAPIILTGLPRGAWAEPQKRRWCARELGPTVPVITCLSRDKHLEARAAIDDEIVPVLVDDRLNLKADWEDIGGIFIHHTGVAASIDRLRQLGFD